MTPVQAAWVERLTAALRIDPQVRVVQLKGSLARGDGDRYSDIDLEVECAGTSLEVPDSLAALVATAVVHLRLTFGPETVLHHLLFPDGQIVDLLVRSGAPTPESAAGAPFAPAQPAVLENLLAGFWIGQLKHLKVLHRGLALLAWEGEHLLRRELLRLWFVRATGTDCGPMSAATIHSLTPIIRVVQGQEGERALALLGAPCTTITSLWQSAGAVQDEVARVGRELAVRFGFDYPAGAEETVRQCWARALSERA